MTGGSLPAMIWRAAMTYAHQGIEIKALPGIAPAGPPAARPQVAATEKSLPPPPLRPTVLTRRGTDVLVRIERMMEDASRALPASGEVSELPPPPPGPRADALRPEALASAGGSAPGAVRGN
jgi:penicillin-binding protein 1A